MDQIQPESGIKGRDHEGKIMRGLLFDEKEYYGKNNKHEPTSEKS